MDLRERHEHAQRHPWELARAAFVGKVLDSAGLLTSARRVLDIGSGDAWLAQQVRHQIGPLAEVVCWDANYTAADRESLAAQHPRMKFVSTKPQGTFDLLLLLDVLEHIQDDDAFLSDAVAEMAGAGASVLVTVPAWQSLFSQRDRHLAHHRRYSFASARALLRRSGLHVRMDGGLFHSLLPMRALSVLVERLRGANNGVGVNPVAWQGSAAAARAVAGVLTVEARASLALGRLGVALPGLSYWALCGK